MARQHRYQMTTKWTGNLGAGTSNYRAYGRNHEMAAEGKYGPVLCSSDPAFRGDGTRYNPEELFVGSLSTCHMLWTLHLCADAGIVVVEYTDEADGQMTENADGSGEFISVTLRPRLAITDESRLSELPAIHDKAHSLCFLARSVNFPVNHEPISEVVVFSPIDQGVKQH